MKKLFKLCAMLVTILSFNGSFAQCTIDLANTTVGFTPTSANINPNITAGQVIQIYVPGTISTYTVDSMVITSISGLPTGITYSLNPGNGTILTSTVGGTGVGCIWLSGITADTVGTYPLVFNGTLTSSLGAFPISTIANLDPAFRDTVIVGHPCNVSFTLQAGSTCSGTGQYFTASISAGVSPFTYNWSDGSTGLGDCRLNGGTNLCLTVTDANGCTATACSGVTNQTLGYTVQVTENKCDTVNGVSGYTLDSIHVFTYPAHGNVSADTSLTYLVYCPDTNFAGTDSMLVYACVLANGALFGCDSFKLIFNVAPVSNPILSLSEQIQENQCDTFSYDPNTGYTLDSVQILNNPAHGSASFILGQFMQYCPNSGFTGRDSMLIYACQYANGASYGCDTFEVYLNVQGPLPQFSDTVQVTKNQCDTFGQTAGYTLDSIHVFRPPAHGTEYNDSTFAYLIYCPDSGFLGYDSMLLYACAEANGVPLLCDTFRVYFNVHVACNISVVLATDTGGCSGGILYTAVITGGVAPFTYAWSDGAIATTDCQLNGVPNLCATVTDANGCTATSCTNYNYCTTTVVIIPDSTSCNGQLGLKAVVTTGTAPYGYYWQSIWSGDTSATLCGLNGAPLAGGTYCVGVVDANGCSASSCYTIAQPGNCSFQYAQLNGSSPTIDFYGSYDTSYTLASASWSFGDGSGSNILNPIHNYAGYGSYDVTMTLYYTSGDSCSSTQYIYIYDDSINSYPGCQANFSSYVSNDTVYFTDQSVYNPATWSWNFGDGTGSNLQNPYHIYSSQGSWNVCLSVNDTANLNGSNNLCSSSYCHQVSNVAVQDMQSYLFHGSTVTPGYPLYTFLEYYNNGTMEMNGTAVYRYPGGTTFNGATPAPASVDSVNRLLTFAYDSLLPGNAGFIFVELVADSNLSLASLVYDTLWVNPVAGDVNPADNISTITDSVVGSWDPNGKSVSPKGGGEQGLIKASTPTVSYTVHFQNTGNGPAHNVAVFDTISANIDMASVRVTYATGKYIAQIIGNVLVVSFDNINLPDTSTDLLASQGYLSVIANLKPGLAGGTQIFNTADIYFDANAPIVTNTVVNTLPGVADINNTGDLEFALMPNPASNQVLIRGEFEDASTYELDDMLGRQLLQGHMQATGSVLDVAGLSAGIYLVKVTSGDKTGSQRLVVVR